MNDEQFGRFFNLILTEECLYNLENENYFNNIQKLEAIRRVREALLIDHPELNIMTGMYGF